MKISKIHFEHLRNEAHYQFMLLVKQRFEQNPDAAAIVAAQLVLFYELLAVERQLVDFARTSEYTGQIVKADKRLDRDLVGLKGTINAALHHFDPDMVEAAKLLDLRLKAFRGNIATKAYGEELAAVEILVTDLQNAYAPQVARLNLDHWVKDIVNTQAEFERLFLLRNIEYSERPKEQMKRVRKRIEAAYRQVTDRIDAYTLLNGDSVTGKLIRQLNVEIKYFHDHIRPKSKTDINKATVASIPDQPYEGKPVIPLPTVTVDGRELVFLRDYEISCEDNARPGNALLTIHGRGAYKGQKRVSFIIEGDALFTHQIPVSE
jgi:hypothetical protein